MIFCNIISSKSSSIQHKRTHLQWNKLKVNQRQSLMTSQVKVKRERWRWDRDLTTFVLQNWKLSKIKQKPETEPVTHQEDHCLAFKFTIYCSCRSKSIKETRQCYWTIGGFNFTTYNTCKNKTSNKNNKRVVTIFIWFQSQFLLDYNTPLRDCPLLCRFYISYPNQQQKFLSHCPQTGSRSLHPLSSFKVRVFVVSYR